MDITLVMVKADGTAREFKIDKTKMTIGRDETAKLRIPVASVSRVHCELTFDEDDDELLVKDLSSANGTWVNGKRIKQTELSPGDLLAVGPVVFVVKIDGFPKTIDAKDSYAAGLVGVDEEDHADGAKGAGAKPVTLGMERPKKPVLKDLPPPSRKNSLIDDDDDEDFSKLLKKLNDEDDDVDDDDTKSPTKRK